MKYRVIIQPPAAAEMDEAYLWIAERAPDSATKWFNGLETAIYSLEDFPERCPLTEESKAFEVEIRQLIYGKRVDAYRILSPSLEMQFTFCTFATADESAFDRILDRARGVAALLQSQQGDRDEDR